MDLRADDPLAVLIDQPAAGIGCRDTAFIRVVPGDPETSLLYLKPKAKTNMTAAPCGDPMPQGARLPLSGEELDFIRQWIEAGAQDD